MTPRLPQITRIESTRRQRTLKRQVDVAGYGFWSSSDVVYSFRPAPDNSGVRFFRADLPNSEPIPALVQNRVSKQRQTSLAVGSAQVDMVEHVLAALRVAMVDNCDVVVTAPEAPGLDGSCEPFLKAFLEAGTVEQTSDRLRYKILTEGIFVDDSKKNGGSLQLLPSVGNETYLEYNLKYDIPNWVIPNQSASTKITENPTEFLGEIAPCRTFLTFQEASYLREQGICKRVGPRDVLVFGEDGPINNTVRFDNECARHKVLDMVGDFALAPIDWEGRFIATKTGHQQNAEVLNTLLVISATN